MRSKLPLLLMLALTSTAFAKDPSQYHIGTLLRMDSVSCAGQETQQETKTFAESPRADSDRSSTEEIVCNEYLLQTEKVSYRIRPRDPRQATLLPVGEPTQFRWQKNSIVLRGEDQKDREYTVISITPRSDASTADAAPTRLNHLQ